MFLSTLLLCAGLVLTLPRPARQTCTSGKAKQCEEAEFAPGTDMAGEGFDITKLERKGAFVIDTSRWRRKDKTCTLCNNPHQENRQQKLPLSVVDWRTTHSCSQQVSSQLHHSSESLISSSSSAVENNWQVGLDLDTGAKGASLMLAGTQSKLADYAQEKTKNDKYSFTRQRIFCDYYSYRVSSTPKLHREFAKAVKQLPKTYSPESKQRFYSLINTFGTHYITKVKMGGSVESVTSIVQCQASLLGLSAQEVQMCLEVEASASIHVSMKTQNKHCNKDTEKMESKSSFSSLFRDRFTQIKGGHSTEPDLLYATKTNPSAYKDWLKTLTQNPDIVSFSLSSIHELLPTNAPARKNLRSAVSHYILEKGLWRNCSERCRAGIRTDTRDPCVCQCHNQPAVNQNCCPTRKGTAQVTITVQRASGLWGDHLTATDAYVKVFVNKIQVQRSPVIYNNNNPHWAMAVPLDAQDVSAGPRVRFEVWDEDNKWDDDLLGECEQVLSAGTREDLCNLQHGQLFYKWEVTCAPSLGGKTCSEYKASPMSQSLRGLFVSRHAQPVPRAVLLQKGVFLEEEAAAAPPGNRSLSAGVLKFGMV